MAHRMIGAARRQLLAAVAGLLAAAVAVGVGELVAAFLRPVAAPIIAVGNRFILLTPEPLKEFAIRRFGSNDKHVLLLGIYVVIGTLALLLGIAALRWLRAGVAGLLLFGAVGVYAASTANAARASDVVPTIVGTAAAIAVLVLLIRRMPDVSGDPGSAVPGRTVPDRRVFLAGSAASAALAAGAGFGGRALQGARFDATRSRAAVRLPRPVSPATPLPVAADLDKGAAPFVTPLPDFYRVDTALAVPQLDARRWRLRVHGMVERELRLSYDDLLARPLIERWITMTCVSNEVGGGYVGTARFLGAPLADLLREAGVRRDADQIVGRSSDGMTIGTPTAVIMDGRDAIVAVGMNGEPLPVEHGFPARTVVPGLYGYVSATKWLVDLEATTFAAYDTYWVQRGWAARAPVRLESRIDTPVPFARPRVGERTAIAGVAWYQHVGVEKVEVRIGDGPWAAARLGRVPSTDTWVQWVLPWTPRRPGPVTLRVRATGRDGQLQRQQRQPPFPSGATGWHSVVVQVG